MMSVQTLSSQPHPWFQRIQQAPLIKLYLQCFQSIQFAIVLLTLLAVGTLIGVVMPQESMVPLAEIQERFGHQFTFYQTLGFFHVYSSFWFVTLEVLFFFSLLTGSFKWLKPATLAAVQKTVIPAEQLQKQEEAFGLRVLGSQGEEQVAHTFKTVLKRFGYQTYGGTQGGLYAYKGNFSRLGPSVAHLGILLCLLASVYGVFTGFHAQRIAVPGETFGIAEANVFKTNSKPGLWVGQVPDWKIKVKDFRIDYYADHPSTPKQYYTDLELVSSDGTVLDQKTISVNHPFIRKGTYIYQASFSPTGRFLIHVNDKPVMAEINNQFNERAVSFIPLDKTKTLIMFPFFVQQDPGVTEDHAIFFLRRANETVGDGEMPPNIRLTVGESGVLEGIPLTYEKPEVATGLQIKGAPEVPLMYFSYLIIAVGALMCFFSQRQLWVAWQQTSTGFYEMMMYPKTNKARLSFQKELLTLQEALVVALSQERTKEEAAHG